MPKLKGTYSIKVGRDAENGTFIKVSAVNRRKSSSGKREADKRLELISSCEFLNIIF